MTESQKNQLHEIRTTLQYAISSININQDKQDKPDAAYYIILKYLAGLVEGVSHRIREEIKKLESVLLCQSCKKNEAGHFTSEGDYCGDCFQKSGIAEKLIKAVEERLNAKTQNP